MSERLPDKTVTKLDEITERRIEHYGDCCYNADDAVGLTNGVVEALNALRSRIAELESEARTEAYAKGYEDCLRRGYANA